MTPRVLCLLVGAALTEASCFVGIDEVEEHPSPDASGTGGSQAGSGGSSGGNTGGSGGSGASSGSGGAGGTSGAGGDASPPDAQTDAADGDAAAPVRVTDGLVALYDFEAGSGTTVADVSGVTPPIDLTIATPAAVSWVGGALRVAGTTVISSTTSTTKIVSACKVSNELTIEVWSKAENLTQAGPARIVSLSSDASNRNFTLGQTATEYRVRLRTSMTDAQGVPEMNAGGFVTTSLQHVALTFDETGYMTVYVDAALTATLFRDGDFSSWASDYPLLVANEATGDRQWHGDLHLVAVYCRGLSQREIAQNFAAGPDGT